MSRVEVLLVVLSACAAVGAIALQVRNVRRLQAEHEEAQAQTDLYRLRGGRAR